MRFLKTDDGLISERYLIRLDHLDPADPWFIKYQAGTRAVDTRAEAAAVRTFLQSNLKGLSKD